MPNSLNKTNLYSRAQGLFSRARNNPKTTAAVLIVTGLGFWWAYGALYAETAPTQYVLGTVEKGTVIASVSASGQISASNQLEIKSKGSGEVRSVLVEPGSKVRAGALLAQLDTTDALKAIRDAQANVVSAQLSLDKIKKPATALTLTQAQNALVTAEGTLAKNYTDSQSDIENAFLDMPAILSDVLSILTGTDAGRNAQWNIDFYKNSISTYDTRAGAFRDASYADYLAAKKSYDTLFTQYQSLGTNPSPEAVEKMLTDTTATLQTLAQSIRSATVFIQLYLDVYETRNFTPAPAAATAITNLNTFTSTLNGHLSSLRADTTALTQGALSITEKKQSLASVVAGADDLDIRSAELSLTKAQNSLRDAQNALADYYVRAPFDGTVASVAVKKFETVGNGTAIATLITNQRFAELSLNEVDVAKISVGDKSTLTFDAIEELTLTGKVAEIDALGTVSQGVVSYVVQIRFDTQDARIKPGMTVNASIITDVRQNVLAVPLSAVKSQNNEKYVLAFTPPLLTGSSTDPVASSEEPARIVVQTGISDDTQTEITSGVTEGQQIVVRTTTATTQTQTTAPSLFGAPGGGRAGAR